MQPITAHVRQSHAHARTQPEEEFKEWKARFIALGHLVITASGEAPEWDEVYVHTAGFPLIRLCIVYAMAVKGICVIADLLGAYLHVPMKGKRVWARMTKKFLPSEWSEYRDPVVPVDKSLYGLHPSGFNYDDWADEKLKEFNEIHLKDTACTAIIVDTKYWAQQR